MDRRAADGFAADMRVVTPDPRVLVKVAMPIEWADRLPREGPKAIVRRSHYLETYACENGTWRIATPMPAGLRLDIARPDDTDR